jgi:hypothetical protein
MHPKVFTPIQIYIYVKRNLGMIHGNDYTTPESQYIFPLPTDPKYAYVEFCTMLPRKEVPAKEREDYMRIEELACGVARRHNGMLLTLHDGKGR